MDSKMSSIVLIGLTLFGWVFTIVMLAEPTAWWKWSYGGGCGCGIFSCTCGWWGGCGMYGTRNAVQAFGVMGVLAISLMLVVHFLQAIGRGDIIPAQVQPYLKFVHIVAAGLLGMTWCLMAFYLVVSDCYNNASRTVNFGLFFGIIVMITEAICFWICHKSMTGASFGCQPLI